MRDRGFKISMSNVLKILVVDDDADLIELLKVEIKKTDYQMIAVSTVDEAIAELSRDKFFCAVLDINLKSISSAPVFSMIKEEQNHSNYNIPIIVMSAFFNSNVIEKLKGKASGVLRKPFSKGQFLNILEHIRNKDKDILLQCQRLLDRCKEIERQSSPSFRKSDICLNLRKEIYQNLEALMELLDNSEEVIRGLEELPEDEFIISNVTEKLMDEYTTVQGVFDVDHTVTVVKGGAISDSLRNNKKIKGQNLDLNFARHSLSLLLEKIKAGADIDERNEYGQTALMLASLLAEKDVMKYLLKKFASVKNKARDGKFPLHFAIVSDDQETVKILLEAGGKTNTKDEEGNAPIHLAITHGNLDVLKVVMGSQPLINIRNKHGEGVVALAVKNQSLALIKYLLENGADPNVVDYDGKTPLDIAIKNNTPDIIDYLKPKTTL